MDADTEIYLGKMLKLLEKILNELQNIGREIARLPSEFDRG
jgi:hypothetical protein